ncbi:MAG: hypothetical protein PHP62_04840, partial [Candidatus Moranbacteria bacterium]|nr:hypothetical protein [Candidatus Moranbacteria bacterium]
MKTLAKIFFGVDSFEEMKKRGFSMMLIVPAIRWGEWVLLGTTASVVIALKAWGFGDVSIFFILWIGNLTIEFLMVEFNDSTEIDVTLMEGLRRLVDTAFTKSIFAGIVIEALVILRLVIWDGSAYFIIFFRNRLQSRTVKNGLFIFASGFQMAVWTGLYIYGYNNFSELFK